MTSLDIIADPFLIVGLTVFVGYLAAVLSKKYSISETLTLMIFGLILGPVLGVVDVGEGSIMRAIYPFMSGIALVILLFDGGISLNLYNVFGEIKKATIYTLVTFTLSVLSSLVLVFFLGIPWLYALLVGAVLGGTSSSIVLTLVEKLKDMPEQTKILLTLESVLTDSLVIIVASILMRAINSAHVSFGSFVHDLMSSLLIAAFLGALFAYIWQKVIEKNLLGQHTYVATLALLLIIYSLTNYFGANGGLAVFTFGLVFANLKNVDLAKSMLSPHYLVSEKKIRDFQTEITFFVRTFFFVYIGLLFPLKLFNWFIVVVSLVLTALYILVRFVSYQLLLKKDWDIYNRAAIVWTVARGLPAAVMVGILLQNNINIPYLEMLAFSVIFFTNLVSTLSIFGLNRLMKSKEESNNQGEDKSVKSTRVSKGDGGEVEERKANRSQGKSKKKR